MITSLTKEQEQKLEQYVKEGIEIGLCTKPLDKDKLFPAIDLLYKNGGLSSPEEKVIVKSPLAAIEYILGITKEYTKNDLLNNFCYGNQDISWIQFYRFFQNECGIKSLDGIGGLYQMALHSGWYLAFDSTIVVCEKPLYIHRNLSNQLHRDMGPALEYSDGFSLYYLNGIAVPKEFVLAKSTEISVQSVMKESNVDIRRELLKKVGLERFISETKADTLDELTIEVNSKKCVYKLLKITLGDGVTAVVLKMDNPSIDAIHVEGVEDTCKTVKEALAWRNGFDTYIPSVILT